MNDGPPSPGGAHPTDDAGSDPVAEVARLRAAVARLESRLERATAERQALARELAEAQTQAEQTLARLASAHARELERRDAQHDARLAQVAEAQREALDAARSGPSAPPHPRQGDPPG